MTAPRRRPRWEWLGAVVIIAACFGLWEALARAKAVSPVFFPAPTVIFRTMGRLTRSGALPVDLGMTLQRLAAGFILGAVPGVALGLAAGWSRRLRAVTDPLVAAAHPIPKIAILPLVMVILGIGETSKIALVAITAFFPMIINTMAGVRHISPIHFEVARNYGAKRLHIFRHVIFPGSLPMILTGVRLALNMALLVTIATELVSANKGLGALIWRAWQTLRVEELYAGLFVASALGIGFNGLVFWLSALLTPWRVEQDAGPE
jgi:NitT/TauT family transport system permease protein